jgi:hypothetical protein
LLGRLLTAAGSNHTFAHKPVYKFVAKAMLDMSASPQPQNAFQKMMNAAKQQDKTPSKSASKRSASKQQPCPQLPTPKKLCLGASPAAAMSLQASPLATIILIPALGSSQEPGLDQLGSHAGAATASEAPPAAGAAAAATTQHQCSQGSTDLASGYHSQETGDVLGAAAQQQPQQQHAAAVAAFKNMFGSQRPSAEQKFTHLLVYDFEATCNKQRCAHRPNQQRSTAGHASVACVYSIA